eukprot:COSAG01_NODE_58536_length_305_cov_1.150485_1_plen_59_part_10
MKQPRQPTICCGTRWGVIESLCTRCHSHGDPITSHGDPITSQGGHLQVVPAHRLAAPVR